MVGQHHRLNAHEFEQALGIGDGQGSLAFCSQWDYKQSNTTDQLNWTEAEDIKKKWEEYTIKLYKKDLLDPDNHDGVITHLEPDILECEVKWALLRKHHYEQSQWR